MITDNGKVTAVISCSTRPISLGTGADFQGAVGATTPREMGSVKGAYSEGQARTVILTHSFLGGNI